MVGFGVVGHDYVNVGGAYHGGNPRQQLILKTPFHRVDKGDFFVHDKIGIISRALGGFVTMKLPHGPINRPNPIYILGNLYRFHVRPPHL